MQIIFLNIFFVLFLYVTLGFIISSFLKRNDIADVMWGPGIFLAIFTAFYFGNSNLNYAIPILTLTGLWALRIFLHIGKRFISKKEEDFRYKIWRENWNFFYLRSYAQIFLLQGFLMVLVSSSAVLFLNSSFDNPYKLFFYSLGITLGFLALSFETIADLELTKFLKLKTGGIMKTGLWKYSRHPNYFGEVCFWWMIFLATLPNSIYFINPFFLISPLTITFLILYVSGIPMLEKKYIGNQEFEDYKSKTSSFFPLPSKE